MARTPQKFTAEQAAKALKNDKHKKGKKKRDNR